MISKVRVKSQRHRGEPRFFAGALSDRLFLSLDWSFTPDEPESEHGTFVAHTKIDISDANFEEVEAWLRRRKRAK